MLGLIFLGAFVEHGLSNIANALRDISQDEENATGS
jgi:hypothetical protein